MGAGQRLELDVPDGRLQVQTDLALVVHEGVAGNGALHRVPQPQVQKLADGSFLGVEIEAPVGMVTLRPLDPSQSLGAVLLGGPQALGTKRALDGDLDVLAAVLAVGDRALPVGSLPAPLLLPRHDSRIQVNPYLNDLNLPVMVEQRAWRIFAEEDSRVGVSRSAATGDRTPWLFPSMSQSPQGGGPRADDRRRRRATALLLPSSEICKSPLLRVRVCLRWLRPARSWSAVAFSRCYPVVWDTEVPRDTRRRRPVSKRFPVVFLTASAGRRKVGQHLLTDESDRLLRESPLVLVPSRRCQDSQLLAPDVL